MSEENLQKQDLRSKEQKEVHDIREQVWEVADSILESGRYPTRKDICQALKKSSHTVGTHFTEWRKANPKSGLAQAETKEISGPGVSPGVGSVSDLVAEMAATADKNAQYLAAGETVLTQELYRHYRKTQQFGDPELQRMVDEANQKTADVWEEELENFSPAAILARFGK